MVFFMRHSRMACEWHCTVRKVHGYGNFGFLVSADMRHGWEWVTFLSQQLGLGRDKIPFFAQGQGEAGYTHIHTIMWTKSFIYILFQGMVLLPWLVNNFLDPTYSYFLLFGLFYEDSNAHTQPSAARTIPLIHSNEYMLPNLISLPYPFLLKPSRNLSSSLPAQLSALFPQYIPDHFLQFHHLQLCKWLLLP